MFYHDQEAGREAWEKRSRTGIKNSEAGIWEKRDRAATLQERWAPAWRLVSWYVGLFVVFCGLLERRWFFSGGGDHD